MPKFIPRSGRAQYLVDSTLYYSTVGLVINLKTGNISPQLHLVFDDYFETLNAGEYQEPLVWSELITFQSLNSAYDDEYYSPNFVYEWLEPAALEAIMHQ